jgi:DNA primase
MGLDKNQLKSVAYIDHQIRFVEKLLGVRFRKVGRYLYSTHCPFHEDKEPSFRARVDHKGEVRFRCWGACDRDCDIYELIRIKRKCSLLDAVLDFALFAGVRVDKIKFSIAEPSADEASVETEESEDPVSFLESPEPAPEYITAMTEATGFYNQLLAGNPDRFKKVLAYLQKRGVLPSQIQDFRIGFAPGPGDVEFAGRALIRNFLDRFNADYKSFRPFSEANLVRLINDDSNYRRYVDPMAKCAFRTNYLDFFAGRIVFPVYNMKGEIQGVIGRRPDNTGTRWIKQQGAMEASTWLYGIDKAHSAIKHYKVVILVEGIFDYFAFYNLLQNQSKPFVLAM